MHRVGEATLVEDLISADWLNRGIRRFALDVTSVVPSGFAAYARILHPAYRKDPRIAGGASVPVTWAEIANRNGTIIHPEVQFESLVGHTKLQGNEQIGLWDMKPDEGNLDPDLAAKLSRLLGRYTSTPEECWFAVWFGWADADYRSLEAPTFDLPDRSYYLFRGPCRAASQSFGHSHCGAHRSANLWWPNDHAWCVASEIDLNSTYIGGTEECIGELLAELGGEILRVEPSCGITVKSDRINPSPTDPEVSE